VYDDGGGEALYVGGAFDTAGGVEAKNIAKWDGSSWSPLGSGLDGFVNALKVHDDGGGEALYAGGLFTMAGGAGGVAASRIAKWDGSSWSALGAGMNQPWVSSLAVYDDGAGAALYAGGRFTTAGGVAANGLAKWDGSRWSPLGRGVSSDAIALAVYDDGGGAALFAGGTFTTAFDSGDSYLAKWGCSPPPHITSVEPLPQPGAGGIRK